MITCNREEASKGISNQIAQTKGDIILVLLSGGSSAQVGVNALAALEKSVQEKIIVTLADERLVEYDSPDSNAKLLKDLGVQKYCNQFIEVLAPAKSNIDAVKDYNRKLKEYSKAADSVIAILGVGPDNHTAGILPNSDAAVSKEPYVVAYDTALFNRVTIAPDYFTSINSAYIYAEGIDKLAVIQEIEQEHDTITYPSQLVKRCAQWTVLYNKEAL